MALRVLLLLILFRMVQMSPIFSSRNNNNDEGNNVESIFRNSIEGNNIEDVLRSNNIEGNDVESILRSNNTESNSGEGISSSNNIEDLFLLTQEEELSAEASPFDNAVLDKIKARMLKSLNLSEAPKSHASLPPLQSLNEQKKSLQLVHFPSSNERRKSVFLESSLSNESCTDDYGRFCIRFQIEIPSAIRNGDLNSVELWINKKEGVTEFNLTQIINTSTNGSENKTTIVISNQTEHGGWQRFDATSLLQNDESFTLIFEVSSESVDYPIETKNNSPFLLVRTIEEVRSQRSADCTSNGSSSCCRKKLYVSFKDVIGWDWVVEPEGYEPNFCEGSCLGEFNLALSSYAHVMQQLCLNEPDFAKMNNITQCTKCTPTAFMPLSVIYLDVDGVNVIRHLSNMSVKQCKCT